ncbi:MAG: ATP-binding protein [Pseudomonadota bacterium]
MTDQSPGRISAFGRFRSAVGERIGLSGTPPQPISVPDPFGETEREEIDLSLPVRRAERFEGFGLTSPITRKIVSFNLVALTLLVGGVLFLNRFESGLIEQREDALLSQGVMISRAAVAFAGRDGAPNVLDPGEVELLLNTVARPTGARVQVFAAGGTLLGDSLTVEGPTVPALPAAPARESILGVAYERLKRIFVRERPEGQLARVLVGSTDELVEQVLAGESIKLRNYNRFGEIIVTVALPIVIAEEVVGAVLIATLGGDIDAVVQAERRQVLLVFVVALASSLALSFVLANSISRPLRMLARAAEAGGVSRDRRLNPGRIQIPDLTGRPDEIGYLSKAMRTMTASLYDRIEANESFAADVTHEIKNPLTSLRSAVESMQYAKDDNARARLTEVIEKDVTRLDRLVTDVSNASRLDLELVRAERETFDLSETLRNLVEFNQPKAEEIGATIHADLPEHPLTMQGLEGRLAQVFVNLISNALSFTPKGGTVTVRARLRDEERIMVIVEDTGPGIPDDNLADIFSRFYSERSQEDFGRHSGLGLAISRQIIEAHGGEIWAENIRPYGTGPETAPMGARFVADLPR